MCPAALKKMKAKTVAFAAFGGAAAVFLLYNGHYIVRYVWLNIGQPFEEWTPIAPSFPTVREVDWSNVSGWPYANGPVKELWGKRLLMLQSYTPNIAGYADLSAKLCTDYCKSKGYRYKAIVSKGPSSTRNPCWDKVFYTIQEFKYQGVEAWTPSKQKSGDNWIFWIDSDAAVSDYSKYIEAIGNMDDNADLFICTSIYFSKNVNTGAMLFRMTPWMHRFLRAWWAWPNDRWHQTMCHEQSALDEMISKDHMGIVSSGKLALFGCTEFNSTYQHGMRVKGKMVQHYRGCSTEKRIAGFTSISSEGHSR